jgi:hypothetical protein
MPRGVPKAGFRKTKRWKASAKRRSFSKPSERREVNMKPVNKKPAPKASPPPVKKELDVDAYLAKLKEVTEGLRACSEMATHSVESKLLMDFAICIERQIPPKYLYPDEEE